MKIFSIITNITAIGLIIFNAFQFDFENLSNKTNTVTLITILAALIAIVLLEILRISKKIEDKTKKRG